MVGISPMECAPYVGQFKIFVKNDFSKFIDLGGHKNLRIKRQLFVD